MTRPPDRKCNRCEKPCYGYYCKECLKHGTKVSQRVREKRQREKSSQ